ncbi:hypothetical protein [Pseudomonas sp. NBRC 111127]|uniref:hypothetical protein n=1 Tax=Pseudomonas sp. NBRC 111127 TaxID=1661042 RepID=UPI0006D43965|nr:hypothetical protein [Pseudomonas sp. NBRC 111127]
MADQTQRLEIATVRAEVGSNIVFRFANDAANADSIPTQSGDIQNLKQVVLEIQQDAAEKISISTTIYPNVSAGLAETADQGIFLVQSNDADEIYAVWQNQGGTAVNTGKTALSATAIQAALDASNEAAQAAEDAADVATARTAGFLAPAATAPDLRDNGLPLQPGDRYFNTTEQAEYIYKSEGWIANDSLAAIASLEATITEDPAPGNTPRASSDGRIGVDWLDPGELELFTENVVVTADELISVNDGDFFAASRPEGVRKFSALNVWNYIKSKVYNLLGLISVDFSSYSGIDLTGATDSTAALQAALNSGVTRFTGKGVISSGPVTLPIGVIIDGNDQLRLRYIGPAGGDFFTYIDANSGFKQLSGIRNTRITTTVAGGRAVVTPKSANAWNRQYRFDFSGLQSSDDNISLTIASNYWAEVLRIGDCRQFRLNRYSFFGGWNPSDTDGVTHACKGVVISSETGAIGISIYDGSCTSMSRAYELSDGVEGHEVHGNEAVSCWEGLIYSNANEEPGGFVYGNHFNCSKTCIGGSKRVELNIGPNSYYRSSAMAVHSEGWSAVDLSQCNYKVTIGAIHAVPGSAVALPNSYAIRLTNCAATFLRIQDFDLSLQMTGAILLDSVSGLRVQGGSARGMNEFCRVQNTFFNTTDVKMVGIDASNTDATLLVVPAGFSPTGIYVERAPRGALNSPASLTINSNSDFTIQPKAGLTTVSLNGTALTANLVLSKVGATAGDKVRIKYVNASATGHTVSILSGSAGTVLNIIRSGNTNRYYGEYEFNGTNWACNYLILDLDATLRT